MLAVMLAVTRHNVVVSEAHELDFLSSKSADPEALNIQSKEPSD
jgi:hypothetical protein